MPEQKKWQVIVSIPFKMIVENGMPPSAGDKWLFSFSRYDYTRPEPKPIFSSTSPHAEVNYHRIEEWGTMVLL
jgi:hypothetical protein